MVVWLDVLTAYLMVVSKAVMMVYMMVYMMVVSKALMMVVMMAS